MGGKLSLYKMFVLIDICVTLMRSWLVASLTWLGILAGESPLSMCLPCLGHCLGLLCPWVYFHGICRPLSNYSQWNRIEDLQNVHPESSREEKKRWWLQTNVVSVVFEQCGAQKAADWLPESPVICQPARPACLWGKKCFTKCIQNNCFLQEDWRISGALEQA